MSKIFVTGISGSGKTTYATKYSENNNITYIEFDKIFDYRKSSDYKYVKNLYDNFPDNFIIDAIPFNNGWNLFKEYIKTNQVEVVVMVCSNPVIWILRLFNKFPEQDYKKLLYKGLEEFYGFYYKIFPTITDLIEYKILDTFNNTYIDLNTLYKRIEWANAICNVTPFKETNE
jgi:GTPase SAR1 family protein